MRQSSPPPLPKAINAEQRLIHLANGVRVNYYVDDTVSGRPLVLVHSINAAPSAMEMRPLFERVRGLRPVYALELPGFGGSERGDLPYSPGYFAGAIAQFVTALALTSPDIIALSLSAEFAARAVVEEGMACHSLVLISPTGVGGRGAPDPAIGDKVLSVLKRPWLGQTLWRTLTSKTSIRFFLGKAFYHRAPSVLVDYAWATAHQPEAHFAPFAFLSMRLFTADAIQTLYRHLNCPTLVIFDEDPNIDFDRLPELERANTHVTSVRIAPTRGLPQWEQPEATEAALEEFWSSISAR